MEPMFEAQGVQNDDAFRRFNWAVMRDNKVLPLFRAGTVLFFVAAGISVLISEFLSFALCLCIAIFLMIMPKHSIESVIKDMDQRKSIAYRQPFTIRFFEEELMEFTPYNDSRIPYTMIHRVLETAEDVYIFTSPTQALIVQKADITKGTPSALSAFLRDEKNIAYRFI